ncbi:MAG TPA: hypothetical protein VJP85_15535 [Candidatus Baltobacteraceae bacterium]|nr:hypothetical protein [Candidatus Baltobacteraceae bacterium]
MDNDIPDEIRISAPQRLDPITVEPGHPLHSGKTQEPETVELEFAPSLEVEDLAPQVERVLEALGHPEAWVSDESTVDDFGFDDAELAAAARELGVAVQHDDYILDIARRLRR